MITEDYVSFELAKKLKEVGFNIPCYTFYDVAFPKDDKPQFVSSPYCHNHNANPEYDAIISAPSLSLVAKWLREEKDIYIEISKGGYKHSSHCFIDKLKNGYIYEHGNIKEFDSYEQALSAGISKALELLK